MYKGTGYAAKFNHPREASFMIQDLRDVNPKRCKAMQAACN